jgi:cytochrome c oxidase subunit 3/cytochrome o ubiquinol oxidase subunit 3
MTAASTGTLPASPVAAVAAPPRGRVGIAGVILTESAFFSIFVAAYVFYIGKSQSGPLPRDVLTPPIFNSICLLASSVTIVLAVRALRNGHLRSFGLWWLATWLLGFEFIVGTGMEWYRLIHTDGLTIRTNLFGTTYYALVGLHATHVVVGLVMIGLVMVLAAFGHVSERHAERTEVLSWYWHFVDVVWIVVFLTVYVIGR